MVTRLNRRERLADQVGGRQELPAHCTGWRAQMRLATELPDAFVPGSVGSHYRFAA